LRIDKETGQVLDVNLLPIPGLYTAGEMVGGLFYFNYPSGTGSYRARCSGAWRHLGRESAKG
jgi:predicted oxidoreductase